MSDFVPDKSKKPIFGIQGGKGSFNEQALHDYVERHNLHDFEVQYLYNTENVFTQLENGRINYGQFALHNATGGLVNESLRTISAHTFEIVEELGINIAHSIMTLQNVKFDEIDTFMAHPQVFKQCQVNLGRYYPNIVLETGSGDLIDTAKAAEELKKGNLRKNIAILGPKILADIYDLKVIRDNLQDIQNNITTFLMIRM
jgi:prephenate dehydratase